MFRIFYNLKKNLVLTFTLLKLLPTEYKLNLLNCRLIVLEKLITGKDRTKSENLIQMM